MITQLESKMFHLALCLNFMSITFNWFYFGFFLSFLLEPNIMHSSLFSHIQETPTCCTSAVLSQFFTMFSTLKVLRYDTNLTVISARTILSESILDTYIMHHAVNSSKSTLSENI